MREPNANMKIMAKLMLRLLPIQVLLAAVGSVNGIVSSFFATNYVGVDAMSAVGLYGPVGMLVTSIATMLAGGSVILCGKYMGQNQQGKLQNVFSLNLLLSALIAALFTVIFFLMLSFDLTDFLTRDGTVRPIFNRYLLGQTVGTCSARRSACSRRCSGRSFRPFFRWRTRESRRCSPASSTSSST